MEQEGSRILFDVLSADQITRPQLEVLINRADQFQRYNALAEAGDDLATMYLDGELPDDEGEHVDVDKSRRSPRGPTALAEAASSLRHIYRRERQIGHMAVYFWFEEPSTRTVGSFDAARALLGMERLGVTNAKEASSSAKGETFADSMRTAKAHLGLFGGAVVITRHPDESSAYEAAEIHDFPVINAGNGQDQHPTQAIKDMYTIWRRMGRLDNLHVVAGGDPRYSRTVHSLPEGLALYPGNKLTIVGDSELWLEDHVRSGLESKGIEIDQTDNMGVLSEADVVYWTRLQEERWSKDPEDRQRILDAYMGRVIDETTVKLIRPDACVMHPGPRGPELPVWFDKDPRSAYWQNMEWSVGVSAAIIEKVMQHYWLQRKR